MKHVVGKSNTTYNINPINANNRIKGMKIETTDVKITTYAHNEM